MSKIKIGLLIDDLNVSEINSDLINWIIKQKELNIELLVINNIKKNKISRFVSIVKKYSLLRILEKTIFKMIFNFEKFIYSFFLKQYKFKKIKLDELKINKILTTPNISKNHLYYNYTDKTVTAIKSYNLDLIIRMGSGIIKGDILTSAKYGILSFHHADNEINRGGPAGFWEVYHRQPESGFIIQQLTEVLDGGIVLKKGFFPTKIFYFYNQIFLYKKSNYYFKDLILYIIKNDSLPESTASKPYNGKIYKDPNLIEIFRYLTRTYSYILKKFFNRLLKEKNTWYVAYQSNDFKNMNLTKFNYIKNRPNSFNADPFLFKFKDNNYLFVENYNFKNKKGCISVYLLENENYEFLGDVLIEKFHLSFPYIFSFENKIYMCPETNELDEIRIYECINFPLKWRYKMTLIKGVSAADTMIFEHNKIWWLLTNIDYSNIGDHSSEFSIFYSLEGPLTSDWKAHKFNPLIVDSKKARNAGIIFDNDKIYRISQKYGFDVYGKEININIIKNLDTNLYQEKNIKNIKSNFFKDIIATHHMNSNADYVVVDCCKKNYFNKDDGLNKINDQIN